MKKYAILLALGVSAVAGYSQGQLTFNTLISGGAAPYGAPIYGVDPAQPNSEKKGNNLAAVQLRNPAGTQVYAGAPLAGTGFTAQLWLSTDGGSTFQIPDAGTGTRNFSTVGALAGHLSSGVSAQYALQPGGTIGMLQVRAWQNNVPGTPAATWAVVLMNDNVPRGVSTTFASPALSIPPATPPSTPGMTSFQLFTPIPEPSVIALGALGLGALLLRRRKA